MLLNQYPFSETALIQQYHMITQPLAPGTRLINQSGAFALGVAAGVARILPLPQARDNTWDTQPPAVLRTRWRGRAVPEFLSTVRRCIFVVFYSFVYTLHCCFANNRC